MLSNQSEFDPVEYVETTVNFMSINIPNELTQQPVVQLVEPPMSADLQYLDALFHRRYDLNIKDGGSKIPNLIKDITAFMIFDSAIKVDRRLRLSHSIINSARVELSRINATLNYADALNDIPMR